MRSRGAPSHTARMGGQNGGQNGDHEAFIGWIRTSLRDAERALHDGDPEPRRELWSAAEPVSVLGAWRNALGQTELQALFTALGRSFSRCTSYELEVLAFDVVGDAAWTVALEHTAASVDDEPRTYTLRATQVYRREDGHWRVAHRHADTLVD